MRRIRVRNSLMWIRSEARGLKQKEKTEALSARGTIRKPTQGMMKRLVTNPTGEIRLKWRATKGAVPRMATAVTRREILAYSRSSLSRRSVKEGEALLRSFPEGCAAPDRGSRGRQGRRAERRHRKGKGARRGGSERRPGQGCEGDSFPGRKGWKEESDHHDHRPDHGDPSARNIGIEKNTGDRHGLPPIS